MYDVSNMDLEDVLISIARELELLKKVDAKAARQRRQKLNWYLEDLARERA